MELIATDIYGREEGYVMDANLDFEIGEDEKNSVNDFEIEYKRYLWTGKLTHGCRVFSPDTEYGGIVKEIATDTKADTVTVKGYTWRGMMTKKIISPPAGQDYATATGELNLIIREKVQSAFPGLFYGSTEDTGVSVNGYQFDRYCTMHEGLVKMLKSVNYRLDIRYMQGDVGEVGWVQVSAVPIVDYSSEYEFSNDNNMFFTMDENKRGVNHLICLGKGELKDRAVEHLYIDGDGEVVRTQFYKGNDEVAEVYDSSGSERDDLLVNGKKKLEEIKNKTEYNMTMEKIEGSMDIGDIVGGRDYLMNVSVKKPIGRKIWTISEGKEKVEYKLKGEN